MTFEEHQDRASKNQILSPLQEKAIRDVQQYGRLIGKMHGSVGLSLRWENPEITVPTPKHLTVRSLLRRGLLYTKAHSSHPVIGELSITGCREDWIEDEPTPWEKPRP